MLTLRNPKNQPSSTKQVLVLTVFLPINVFSAASLYLIKLLTDTYLWNKHTGTEFIFKDKTEQLFRRGSQL